MSYKILKVTLATRVQPDLKKIIYEEADELQTTPSSYVEEILINRKPIKDYNDQEAEFSLQQLEVLQEENAELSASLEALKLEMDGLATTADTAELQELITELEAANEEVSSQLNDLIVERDDFAQNYHVIQKENEELLKRLHALKSSVGEEVEIVSLEQDEPANEHDTENWEVSANAEEIEALNMLIIDLEAKNEALQIQLTEAENSDEYKNLNKAINKLKTKNEDLQAQLKELKILKEELLNKVTELEKGAIQLEAIELEEMEGYVADLKARYPELTTNQIILASLSCAVKNEHSSLWITTIKGYQKEKQRAEQVVLFNEMINAELEEVAEAIEE